MDTLATLRAQHDEISAMLLGLYNSIRRHRTGDDSCSIALDLAQLMRLLREHLAIEDQWLYPMMIATRQPAAAALARTYCDDMGGLAERVEDFHRRWALSPDIASDFEVFRDEAFVLLAEIDRRIDREDSQLFPAASALGIGLPANAA